MSYRPVSTSPRAGSKADLPVVKLYGERNCGTNYVSALLRRNLAVKLLPGQLPKPAQRVVRRLPRPESIRDAYFDATFGRHLGWKHMQVDVDRIQRARGDVGFVVLVKHPSSWLVSLMRRPYQRVIVDDEPLTIDGLLEQPWPTVRRENGPSAYPDAIAMWGAKVTSYAQLARVCPTVLLRYEDVVADPEQATQQIAEGLGLRRADQFTNVVSSTKDPQKTFVDYQAYYLEERWRCELSPHHERAIAERLDRDAMRFAGYAEVES